MTIGRDMDNNRGFFYFCTGCAAGIAAALLFNSQSGRQAVEYVRGMADEGTRAVKESVDNVNHAVSDVTARGMKAVRYQTENVTAAVDAGKRAFREAQQTTP